MSTMGIGSVTVAYDDIGEGRPLVLVHGHPFDRTMWRPQIEHFAGSSWRIIAPDLRGYGATSVVPGTVPLEVFAADVVALVDRLDVDRFVLGGLSMGGQVVMEVYRTVSHRIDGLIFASTSPHADTAEGKNARRSLADRLVAQGMEDYAAEILPRMVAPDNIVALPEVAAHVLGMMRSTPPQGAAAALRGRAERRSYVALMEQITVPVLVLVGSGDSFTPPADAKLMSRLIPDATLEVVAGAGHMPNLEQPAAVNGALATFLASVAARPPRGVTP